MTRFLLSLALIFSFTFSEAQISLSGTSYTQAFDAIGSGLPTGFSVVTSASASALGTTAAFTTAATAWTSTTSGWKNSASADGLASNASSAVQNAAIDRSLTLRQSGSFGDPGAGLVMQLANTTGFANFNLSFKLQSLDSTSPRTTTWLVDYGFGATPTAFSSITTTPTPITSGNSVYTNVSVSVNFGSLLNNQNQNVWIRIVSLSASTGSGNRATTGFDDLALTYTASGGCTAPTTQVAAGNISSISSNSFQMNWTKVASANSLVVIKQGSAVAGVPANGTSYTANATFGSGQTIAAGEYVVYNGSAELINITGLSQSTKYYIAVFSLNTATNCYNVSSPFSVNATTLCITPSIQVSNTSSSNSNTSATLSWNLGNGDSIIVRLNTTNTITAPVNGTHYSANSTYSGSGQQWVYKGVAANFNLTGLSASTSYYATVYTYNGCNGSPQYLTTGTSVYQITTTNVAPSYYSSATGLTCAPLKTALYNIVKTGVTPKNYSDLWTIYTTADVKLNERGGSPGTYNVIWDIYSDNPTGLDPYEFIPVTKQCGTYSVEGDCYNREHSFPQSWFGGGTTPGPGTDYHHIYPTDGKVNADRSNYVYGETSSPTKTSLNGSKLGPSSFTGIPSSVIVFEPINEYKGDVARAFLYMLTMYQNNMATWAAISTEGSIRAFEGTTFPSIKSVYLQLMLKWHNQDPVSAKEIARNNSGYSFQGNRNPFIDHPEYVASIWNGPCSSISYTGNPYCSSGGTASVTLVGTSGGVYSSTSGLVINASTGAVTLASSTPGTYTVTYTVSGQPVTTAITINQVAQISSQPANQVSCFNSSVSLSVTATGTGLTYQWRKGNSNLSNTANVSGVTSATLVINSLTVSDTAYNYNVVVSGSNPCGSLTSSSAAINLNTTNTWIGTINDDWNTATNWCLGIPTTASTVVIPSGTTYSPNIKTATATANTVSIQSGATLTMLGNYNLNLSGTTFSNAGTLVTSASTGQVVTTGSITYSGALMFKNLQLNGSTVFESAVTVTGTLIMGSGSSINSGFGPIYGGSSTLSYASGGTFVRGKEWSAVSGSGFPKDVVLSNNTLLDAAGGGNSNVVLSLGGNLTVQAGSVLNMSLGANAMTQNLVIAGNLALNGSLIGSTHVLGGIKISQNWTMNPSATFTPSSSAVEFNGTVLQQINGATTFGDFKLNNAGGLVLNAITRVAGVVKLTSGVIFSEPTKMLIFENGASVGTGSDAPKNTAFVDGPVRKIGNAWFVFPVGKAGTGYQPIEISSPTQAADAFTATYNRGNGNTFGTTKVNGLKTVSGCEYWDLERTIGSSTVDVTIYGNTNSGCGAITGENYFTGASSNTSSLTVAHWNSTTNTWEDYHGIVTGTASSLSVRAMNVSSFSPFTFGSNANNPLPVTLVNFSASKSNNQNLLTWETASEINFDKFEIETANLAEIELNTFSEIGEVKANGIAGQINKYTFIDTRNTTAASQFYRLKMVDLDGTFAYSDIKQIKSDALNGVRIYPNPSKNDLQIDIRQDFTTAQINVVDMLGKTQISTSAILEIRNGFFNTSALSPGIYIIQINVDNQTQTFKWLKSQ